MHVPGGPAMVSGLDAGAEQRTLIQARLIGRVGSDGGVRDRCGSRVLESSLMLHLLRVHDSFPRVQRSIVAYLARQIEQPLTERGGELLVGLESALIDRMLGDSRAGSSGALRFLVPFNHFSARRKRFMFHTLLAELNVIDPSEPFDLDAVDYTQFATWVNVEMCALKILRAHQIGRPEQATAADRQFLLDQLTEGSKRAVFEADVFAHLIGLLALSRLDPGHRLIGSGIRSLLRCQNPDGGLPFIAGWEPFLTAVTGLALAASGAPDDLVHHLGSL